MRRIFPNVRKARYEETKAKLTEKCYIVSPNYGLISEEADSDLVIADIRYFEKKVILPYYNEVEHPQVGILRKILIQEKIPFREKRVNS